MIDRVLKIAILAVALIQIGAISTASAQTAAERINKIIDDLNKPKSKFTKLSVPKFSDQPSTYDVDYNSSISMRIQFAFGSATIRSSEYGRLAELGSALEALPLRRRHFLIIGHTDAVGDDRSNLQLSWRRANAVRRHLMRNFDIPWGRLTAVGLGETKTINGISPYAARNRRVEIVLRKPKMLPLTKPNRTSRRPNRGGQFNKNPNSMWIR